MKLKKIVIILIVIFLVSTLSSCVYWTKQYKNAHIKINIGSWENDTYRNDAVGFSADIPSGWYVYSLEELYEDVKTYSLEEIKNTDFEMQAETSITLLNATDNQDSTKATAGETIVITKTATQPNYAYIYRDSAIAEMEEDYAGDGSLEMETMGYVDFADTIAYLVKMKFQQTGEGTVQYQRTYYVYTPKHYITVVIWANNEEEIEEAIKLIKFDEKYRKLDTNFSGRPINFSGRSGS